MKRLLDDKPVHRSGEIPALCAVPYKKEQCLSPCCMYTKPACCLQVGHTGLEGNSGICFLPWDISELQSLESVM